MRETIRDTWQDVRFGARMCRRYPGFAAGAIVALTVGVGAASSMFSLVEHSLFGRCPLRRRTGSYSWASSTSPTSRCSCRIPGALFTVVGVFADARDWRVPAGTQLELYVPYAQRPAEYFDVLVRSSAPASTVESNVRRLLHGLDPTLALRSGTLMSSINSTMADRRFIAGMPLAFSMAVLLLTVVGTFGAVSYSVALRTREIGIRLAIGATPPEIWLNIERHMIGVIGVGAAARVSIAWGGSRLLSSLLYGVTSHDAASFLVAPALVCLAGAAAVALPAFRAARTDPSVSLRAE